MQIYISAKAETPRLHYVLQWLFKEQLQIAYVLVQDINKIPSDACHIAYGEKITTGVSIPDAGLLWENGIQQQNIIIGEWNRLPTLFADAHTHTLSFDIFSAIFFLLSRYEEYYSFIPDKYERYPATASALHKNDWLERPLIDEWLFAFRKLLREKFYLQIAEPKFSFLPTYDIDIAWSYQHKGLKRIAGAIFKELLQGEFSALKERTAVLNGKKQDPYDAFEKMNTWHRQFSLQPFYFILSALQTTAFDKNIAPMHPAMRTLIEFLSTQGNIGLHPSYYSSEKGKLNIEKAMLENITGEAITASRQHYIRMQLPDTYRLLIRDGISDDYSMGYGTHIGFRAGTAQSFFWYDLKQETTTLLCLHPFCFMDSTARFDAGLNTAEAFEKLKELTEKLKACNSRLITVFHNFSLGNDEGWKGWSDKYGAFLENITSG